MFQHITYKDKILRGAKELIETNPNDIMKYGWSKWDLFLGGIFGGEIIVVGGGTGSGKTTLCNQIANNVASQGFRVVKYSLENRLENAAKEELFYTCNRSRRQEGLKPYLRGPFISNEYGEDGSLHDVNYKRILKKACNTLMVSPVIELDKDKNVSIDDLEKLIEEEIDMGTRLFIIDHLHYFIFSDTMRLDLQIKNVMHILNELCRKHNIAVILVAHYKNNTGWEKNREMKPGLSYFRDGASISQVAHKVIQIARDEDDMGKDITKFYFTKYRGPIQNLHFNGYFDLAYYEYRFGDAIIGDDLGTVVTKGKIFSIETDNEDPF